MSPDLAHFLNTLYTWYLEYCASNFGFIISNNDLEYDLEELHF
jgi:hypothetical protein